eukprot:1146445-Pelagomonas_calceolata.AAC.3
MTKVTQCSALALTPACLPGGAGPCAGFVLIKSIQGLAQYVHWQAVWLKGSTTHGWQTFA